MTKDKYLLSCIPLLSPFFAIADDDSFPEVIVVTADRVEVNQMNSPWASIQIDETMLERKQYRSTVDALRDVSGVMVQKTGYGQGSPYIRGFTGYRTLFMFDGIKLNNSIFRDGPNQYWSTIDMFSVNHFEVVKGAGSTLYGSDAIGGTVQAFSNGLTLDTTTQGSLIYRGATGESSNIVRAQGQTAIADHSALSLGITAKHFGDVEAGSPTNTQHNTGYDEYNVDAKWLWQINNDWSLTSAFFSTRQLDVPRTHKTNAGISFSGTTVGNELRRDLDQKRQLAYTRLSGINPFAGVDSMDLTFSWHRQEEFRDRLRTNDRHDQQGIDVDTLGLQARFVSQWNETSLVWGYDGYFDSIDSYSSKSDIQGPVADDADYDWHGLYVQSKTPLNDNLSLDAGVRFNYTELDADSVKDPLSGDKISVSDDWSAFVANIKLNYLSDDQKRQYFAGVSQSFRAPNLSDMTRFDSARSNEFEIPSTDLDPEDFITIDAGFRFRGDQVSIDFSTYYTFVDDQIQRFPTGNLNEDGEFEITKDNVGDGYVAGAEFDIAYKLTETLTVGAKTAWLTGKVDNYIDPDQPVEREYISRLMPLTGQLSVLWEPSSDWWLEAQWMGAKRADKLSTRDQGDTQRIPPGGTPGYGLINLRGGYRFNDQFTLNLAFENMFDKNYRVHGSGQNEVGQNLVVSLIASF